MVGIGMGVVPALYIVVIWSDLLGDLQCWQDTLSWHPPDISDQSAGRWRETSKTTKYFLL